MKISYLLLPAFFLIACANNNADKNAISDNKPNGQNAGNAVSSAQGSASIKILEDGKILTDYIPTALKAQIVPSKSGKETLMMEFSSNDNTYDLMCTINSAASGAYSLGEEGKSDAQLQFLTDGSTKLPTMMNFQGNLKITLVGQTCSGSFTGSDKDMPGKNYEVSGSFVSIPVKN